MRALRALVPMLETGQLELNDQEAKALAGQDSSRERRRAGGAATGKNRAKPLSVPRAIAPGRKYPTPQLGISVLGGMVSAPCSSQAPPDGLPETESAYSRRMDSLQLAAHEGGWREAQPAGKGGVCVCSHEGLARLDALPAFVQRQAPSDAADQKEERRKVVSRAREIFAELWPEMPWRAMRRGTAAKPLSVPRAIAPGCKHPQPVLRINVLGGLVSSPCSSQAPPDGLPETESAYSRRMDSLQMAAHEGGWREAQPASVCVRSQAGLARLATLPAFVQRQAPSDAADQKEERRKVGSRASEIFAELWPETVENGVVNGLGADAETVV